MSSYLPKKQNNKLSKMIFSLIVIPFFIYSCLLYSKTQKQWKMTKEKNDITINAKKIIKQHEGKSILTPNDKKELGYYSQYCYTKHIDKFNNKFFVRISEQDAETCLDEELQIIEKQINKIGLKYTSNNIKTSLISLIYNTGLTKFMKSSLYKLLKEQNTNTAEIVYEWINIACSRDSQGKYIKNKGLLKRRLQEVNHFTTFKLI